MKKFLVRLFLPDNTDVLLSNYVQVESEQVAARKLGLWYDEDDKAWVTSTTRCFVTFQEIEEISSSEQFDKIVEQKEEEWRKWAYPKLSEREFEEHEESEFIETPYSEEELRDLNQQRKQDLGR